MKNVLAKLVARRAAAGSVKSGESAKRARKPPASASVPVPVEVVVACAPAVCELCESNWGAIRSDEIAELLVASGRFPEEQRGSLLATPRELLVSIFCGCSAKLRLAPPAPTATSSPRRLAP